jgi:hypothetical protein
VTIFQHLGPPRRPRGTGNRALLFSCYAKETFNCSLLQLYVPVALIDLRLFHQAALAILFPTKVPPAFSGKWNHILADLKRAATQQHFPNSAEWFKKLFDTDFSLLADSFKGKPLVERVELDEFGRDYLCAAMHCLFWGINNLQSGELTKFPHTTANAILANTLFGVSGARAVGPSRSGAWPREAR